MIHNKFGIINGLMQTVGREDDLIKNTQEWQQHNQCETTTQPVQHMFLQVSEEQDVGVAMHVNDCMRAWGDNCHTTKSMAGRHRNTSWGNKCHNETSLEQQCSSRRQWLDAIATQLGQQLSQRKALRSR